MIDFPIRFKGAAMRRGVKALGRPSLPPGRLMKGGAEL